MLNQSQQLYIIKGHPTDGGGRAGGKYYSTISDLEIESAISDSGTKSILLTKFEYLLTFSILS